MQWFDLVLDIGQVAMLCCCVLAVISSTCDRHHIFGLRPHASWFPVLQERAKKAVQGMEQIVAVADAEHDRHYCSQKLHGALLKAHTHCIADDSYLPWFRPRQYVEELECRNTELVAQLEAALEYQKSPAFMLEASHHLRLALEGHPERAAADLEQIERNFQIRLNRLKEEKTAAIEKARERAVVIAREMNSELDAHEEQLRQLAAGTTVTTIFS